MDSSDTQLLHRLNDDEMGRLVGIALEEFGMALTRTPIQRSDARSV